MSFVAEEWAAITALLVLAIMFVGFLLEAYPPAVIALAGAGVFLVLGFVSTDEVLASLANPAPVTIAAMFILSGTLIRTGVVNAITERLVAEADHGGPRRALTMLFVGIALLSGLLNNTPLVLVMIPVVIQLAASMKLAPTKLLIPLSYASILGGTLTLVGTSTNLLVDGVAQRLGLEPFGLFEITPFGLVALAVGSVTLLLTGNRLLPARELAEPGSDDVHQYLTEVEPLGIERGNTILLAELEDLMRPGIKVLSILRNKEHSRARPGTPVRTGDRIVVLATGEELLTLDNSTKYRIGRRATMARPEEEIETREVIETFVPPGPNRMNTIAEMALPSRYGVRVLGVNRNLHVAGRDLGSVRPRAADRLLLEGTSAALARVVQDTGLIMAGRSEVRPLRRNRAPLAILTLLAVIGLAALNVLPLAGLAILGVAFVLLTHVIEADEAWRSMDGSILILILGMLVVGRGLENTGGVSIVVDAMTPLLMDAPVLVVVLALYFATSVLTETMSNNAVAVVVAPVAIALASSLGIDPRPLVLTVMIAASACFSTPIGYQTNTLVYLAGNYRFTDFLRVGPPMNLSVGIAVSVAIWWWYLA